MTLLSLGGTLAERATPACDLYFLLSAPTTQITEIAHLLKENKKKTLAGDVETTAAPSGGPSSFARHVPPLLPSII